MIIMITRLEVVRGTREKYLEEFIKIVPIVLLQKGCIEYEAYVDSEDERFDNVRRSNVVVIVEKWESIEDLQDHSKSELLQCFRKKIGEIKAKSDYELLAKQ